MAGKNTPELERRNQATDEEIAQVPKENVYMNGDVYEESLATSSSCNTPLLQRRRGRLSFYNQHSDKKSQAKKGGSFMNIFKWFKRRKRSRDLSDSSGTAVNESSSSLNTSIEYFTPLSRSRSSDDQCKLKVNDKDHTRSRSVAGREDEGASASLKSQKKRSAPAPPSSDSNKAVIREKRKSRESENRHTPLDPSNPFYLGDRNSMDPSNPFYSNRNSLISPSERRNSKSSIDDSIYSKSKRKAPQPPPNNWTSKVQMVSSNQSSIGPSTSKDTNSSSISNFESNDFSQSGTLKSNNSSISSTLKGSISSKCSGESFTRDKNFISSNTSTMSKTESNGGSPNPKQWYKRKRKSKLNTRQEKSENKDEVYEYWRPEIQIVDGRIVVTSDNRNNIDKTTGAAKSLREKVVEACKPKRKSQISLLANFSQIDEEAANKLEKEKRNKSEQQKTMDDKVNKFRSGIVLTQEDVSSKSPIGSLKTKGVLNEVEVTEAEYDNVQISTPNVNGISQNTSQTHNKNSTLKEEEIHRASSSVSEMHSKNNFNGWQIKNFISENKETSIRENNVNGDSSPKKQSKSVIQMANMDAEMFYRLAKDIKTPPESDAKQIKIQQSISTTSQSKTNYLSVENKKQIVNQRHKNFGVRMNQMFTPDVSVILEGSESIASLSTTPVDEAHRDLNSSFDDALQDPFYNELDRIYGQKRKSEISSKNKAVAREILDELEEVRQEIDRINEEESKDKSKRETDKAEKIREEIINLRERDHFSVWQDLVSSSSSKAVDIPQPIDVTTKADNKLKWICDVCTLINTPWKITCEACSSRRPNKPTRVQDQTTSLSPPISNPGQSSTTSSRDSPVTVIEGNLNNEHDAHLERNIGSSNNKNKKWENELERYFPFNGTNQIVNDNNSDHILYNNTKLNGNCTENAGSTKYEHKSLDSNNLETMEARNTSNTNFANDKPNIDIDPDIEEMRRARIERFEQGIKTFEALIRGTPNTNSIELNKNKREQIPKFSATQVSSMVPQFENEKLFYKKQVRKPPTLNTHGAVKNRISVFNQKEQLFQASPKIESHNHKNKHVNVGLIKQHADVFESRSVENSRPTSRNKFSAREVPRPSNVDRNAEPEILSAISKFDEIAANAELDRLKPKIVRGVTNKKNKRLIIPVAEPQKYSIKKNSSRVDSKNDSNAIDNVSKSNENSENAVDFTTTHQNKKLSVIENCDKRSSICSGSFVLINANEFDDFEAERSQMGSPHPPSDYEDAYEDQTEEPTKLEDQSFQLGSPYDEYSQFQESHEELIPGPSSEMPSDSQPRMVAKLPIDNMEEVEKLSKELTLPRGIDEFKATFEEESSYLSRNSTISITRLLKKLENAIAKGDHDEAAVLAKDLATLKVNCKVIRSSNESSSEIIKSSDNSNVQIEDIAHEEMAHSAINTQAIRNKSLESINSLEISSNNSIDRIQTQGVTTRASNSISANRRETKSENISILLQPEESGTDTPSILEDFNVQMYVEDRSSHQGPIDVAINANMTVGELKYKIHKDFGFPSEFQRWILGKQLADDDNQTMNQLRVTTDGCPVFLYLVAPRKTDMQINAKPVMLMKLRSQENMRTLEYQEKLKTSKQPGIETKENLKQLVSPTLALKMNSNHLNLEDPIKGNELIRKEELDLKTTETKNNSKTNNIVENENKSSSSKNKKQNGKTTTKVTRHSAISGTEEKRKDQIMTTELSNQTKINKKQQSPKSSRQGYAKPIVEIIPKVPQVELPPMPKPTPLVLPSTEDILLGNDNKSRQVSDTTTDGWVCPCCTLVNPQNRPGCEACAAEKPQTQPEFNLLMDAHKVNEADGVVRTREVFECRVCFTEVPPGSGVILRDCLHMFCRDCLALSIKFSDTAAVKCPYRDNDYSCDSEMQEREVKALVSKEDYEKHLNKSVKQAANSMENVFHCKTPDCRGFCVFEDNVNIFFCNVCFKQNCLTCQAQHAGQSCKDYQEIVSQMEDIDSMKTKKFFEDMIRRGDGLPCPHCSVMLVRKWGCDWMRCPMCRTEICWVTRGPRWGPKGQGDTSGGCQCGVRGRKCHPKCTFCH